MSEQVKPLSECDLLKLFAEQARHDAERRAVEEYATFYNPRGLLRDRIYSIIACSANTVIDAPYDQRNARLPQKCGPGSWEANMNSTETRLHQEPMFHRLVNMQASEILEEVERYSKGIRHAAGR